MPFKDGMHYNNCHGHEVYIVGPTKNCPQFKWATNGNWYDAETGKIVCYGKPDGENWEHCVDDIARSDDLILNTGRL